jgi:predicted RNase H-like HicB family nuclease
MKNTLKHEIKKYTYRIEWSEEDQAHIARCLEFPSLAAHGKTPEKALKEIENVVAESVEWIEEENGIVPEPLGASYDTKAPGFAEECHRQSRLACNDPHDLDDLNALLKIADWGEE